MTSQTGLTTLLAGAMMLVAATTGAAEALPQRIVSLGPAITEQLALLDRTDRLVGVTTYCRLPADAAGVTRIGTVTGLSAEPILNLRPDLVLATGLTHPRDMERLQGLGLTVKRFGYAADFDTMAAQFIELADMVGETARAEAMMDAARERLAGVAARVGGRPPTPVFIEIGAKPLFTAGRETFIHDMLVRAGGVNIAADATGGVFSREQVIARNPQVILVVTMETTALEEQQTWLRTRGLRAAASGRVHVLDAYAVCSPTPVGFAEVVADMAALLHPPGDAP